MGRRVILKAPVRRIVQGAGRVRVEADRHSVSARSAIVTVPPAVQPAIDFSPPLLLDGAVRSGERAAKEALADL